MIADITPEERCVSMEAEIRILRSQLAALQSVPQGVEVPEMSPTDVEALWIDWNREMNQLENAQELATEITAWFRARLVPTPPQAAPDLADEVDRILSGVKRYAFDTTKGEYFEIAHGAFMKVDHVAQAIYKRYTPPHPLQPEERRVGPDEVAVDRDYLADLEESVIDTVEQLRVGFVLCENCGEQESTDTLDVMSMNLLPMIPRIEESRTSAQDHNGEGATAYCGTCAQSGHCVDAKWRVVCDDYLALQAPGQRGEG